MRKVVLFIAMSLDGYIADKEGKVDWLQGVKEYEDDMISYNEFIKDMDTVIMGWNTYEQIVSELSKDSWVYEDFMSYVITHRQMEDKACIKFVNDNVCSLIKELKMKKGKDIWICGGANIVSQLMKEALIYRYHISVIPTILGDGISLFEKNNKEIKLKLIDTKTYNGIVDLIYELR